jgi:hypothetical protein
MEVLKFFFSLTRQRAAPAVEGPALPDAGDHPDIRLMDLRQLADLPWPCRPEAEVEVTPQAPPLAQCA